MESDLLKIRPFQDGDEQAVIDLWKACRLVVPQNDSLADIRAKRSFQPDFFLVGTLNKKIVATAMVGYEGHRGWVNYLAVSPEKQKKGFGRLIMTYAEEKLKALGCPKLNIQVRRSNTGVIEFYRRIGFAEDDVVGLGKRFDP